MSSRSEAEGPNLKLSQDEDVLDTWFSSWIWPIEVFNGITQPNNAEFNYYYPTKVLVTGQDIIFFWVARMIMAGYELEDLYNPEKKIKEIHPFDDVYFTGMVRDKQGRKMSKSLGNSPDLLDLIERFGADAVRFGILISAPAGNDLLFDDSSCEQGRFFNNKIWNALKLVKMWGERVESSDELRAARKIQQQKDSQFHDSRFILPDSVAQAGIHDFAIDWFENRLNQVKFEVEVMYKNFKLSEALKSIYSLIWDDFCSWYLEWVKPPFEQQIDSKVYDKTINYFTELMQLLHPFMPFVTEEIYHRLQETSDDLCVKQNSKAKQTDTVLLAKGELLKQTISAIRDARNKNNIKPKDSVKLFIQTNDEGSFDAIETILKKTGEC